MTDGCFQMDEQISLLPGFTHTEPQQLQRLRELAQQDVAEGERLRNAIVAAGTLLIFHLHLLFLRTMAR